MKETWEKVCIISLSVAFTVMMLSIAIVCIVLAITGAQ